MVQLMNVFQADEEYKDPFAPIEEDWYECEIIKSELKKTRAGDGSYLELTFKVVSDNHEGRLLHLKLNLVNKSESAVAKANYDLKRVCKAVGHDGPLEDSDDLHDTPIMVKISIKPASGKWPAQNRFDDFMSISDYEAGAL